MLMVLWFYGFMVVGSRFYGFVVLWLYGCMVLWFDGFMVLLFSGFMVFMVLCLYVFKFLWFLDLMVSWLQISKCPFHVFDKYWSHLQDFQKLLRGFV